MRPPEQVMTLSRLGSLHQCRLSFMRQLLRRLARENWQISRPRFDINSRGEGSPSIRPKALNGPILSLLLLMTYPMRCALTA